MFSEFLQKDLGSRTIGGLPSKSQQERRDKKRESMLGRMSEATFTERFGNRLVFGSRRYDIILYIIYIIYYLLIYILIGSIRFMIRYISSRYDII